MTENIHETAIIDPTATIGEGTTIGPYVTIESNVTIGKNNQIEAKSHIAKGTTLGDENQIHMGAIVGHEPQDIAYKGQETFTQIGNRNIIREYSTIHRGTEEGTSTIIGDDNFFMAYSHVAHNCIVGNRVVLVAKKHDKGCQPKTYARHESCAPRSGGCFLFSYSRGPRAVVVRHAVLAQFAVFL